MPSDRRPAEADRATPNRHLVVATAGHIDHGKSSLVRALTGTDTDRLSEEKRRGISIDLGFAHLDFGDGSTVSFVDVPGHENFVKNMLAGVSGVRVALLIVSATEGVKPQTVEHLDICRLLGISDGLVVVTKADLASDGQIAATLSHVTELCRRTVFANHPPHVVSAVSGLGLAGLKQILRVLADRQGTNDTESIARLPIDRSFALRGFGTVVTGTLLQGSINTGSVLTLQPGELRTRVRGLQMHGKPVERAAAGQRVAVNLAGIDHLQISRGMTLVTGNDLAPAGFVDVRLTWLNESAMPRRRQQFLLHTGTAEFQVSLKLLDNSGTWGRIWLTEPALLLPDDRFVLRRPSPANTVGGGVVLDAFPPRRLNRQRLVERLRILEPRQWADRLSLWAEESNNGRRLSDLLRRSGLSEAQLFRELQKAPELVFLEEVGRIFNRSVLAAAKTNILAWLGQFHKQHASLPGAPFAQAKLDLDVTLARAIFGQMPEVRLTGDLVALTSHRVLVKPEQNQALSQIEHLFREAGYQPPSPSEVLQSLGDVARNRPLLESLIKSNRLVRLSDDIVMHPEVLLHIRTSLAAHKGRRFSVPEFKAWTQVSRKYAIPILEYLDRQRVTRRDGDVRVVL